MASTASCSELSSSASTIARCSRFDCSRRPPSSLRNADWRASASRISSMTLRKTGFWAARATARWKSVSIATQAVVSVSCSIRSSR